MIERRFFRYHSTREAAYVHVCELLRSRGTEVKQINLLQFSGDTAISILQEAAKNCPTAAIRLLLTSYDYAEKFDEPDFHRTRIRHTLGVIKILKETRPDLNIGVWSYQSEPDVAGIIVDDWLVSVGWYHTFPDEKSPTGLSIRGHCDPAVNAIKGAAPELFSLVRKQFDAVLGNAKAETA